MADKNNSANSSSDVHQNGSKEVKIDILDEDWWEPMPGCCIYKVPIDLRKKNEEAYTPQVISIGPLHYGKNELRDMQKQKKRYKHMFKERKGDEKLEEMKRYIKSQEINIRNCYEQPSLLEQYQFVGMILDDTVFIIELFLRHYWNVDDFLLEKPRYKNTVKRDLQLLENQLPYFVLNELYMSSIKGFDYSTTGPPSFLDISCKFFDYKSYADLSKMEGFNVKHFTDLRRYVLMQNHPTSITPKKVVDLPCATKLDKSGVSCKHVEYEDQLLHLKFLTNKRGSILPFFKKYELQIPRIIVNDWTEVLMMALVQCHYPKETHVCNYIAFLDFLINTEKDADLLIEKGIIVNCLGENKAIARTFNNFCLQISRSPSCYSDLAERLKAHYRSPYHHAKATLKSVYFGDPWKGTGTVVGILILLLALANTVHTILRFYVKY
ncbi:hypothetical protein Ddye_018246 [Dipteronia dyeriana]|uniref:Uncharacterized protein n=1 Tax=Dipteronia dyeriana TaxID=168575 RepID=A0AAD9UAW7_9ROSI|nr:hypothetical protein Ddye_018246 [Dipteronia dyeriana]